MQLKKDNNRRFDLPLRFLKNNKGKIIIIFLIIFLLVGILHAFGELGPAFGIPNRIVYKAMGVNVYDEMVLPMYHTILPVVHPVKYIKGLRSNPERIIIDIKNNDYLKLAYKREIALAKGVLISSDDDYVPAKIHYKDQTIDVELRLKGEGLDHLIRDKWSFRIKVKGDNTLFGMKQFSIHDPKTRNYINEWIFHQALKKEGIVSLRYDFIDVCLNGKPLGIYALEEHFEKRLVEHNLRREGPIIRFNEGLMWDEWLQQEVPFPNRQKMNGAGDYLSSDIDAFHTNKILEDSTKYEQFQKANNLLESFRTGELNTSEVFDIDKLAKFFAITDLMGAEHGSRWHNIRFYYNPITSRLEPIGFDGDSGEYITSIVVHRYGSYYDTFFRDPVFFKQYVQELERVTQPSYLDNLFIEVNNDLKRNMAIIHKGCPGYHFSKDVFYNNRNYIRTVLNPVKGLHVYFYRNTSNGSIILEVGNIQSMPIEILNVSYKELQIFEPKQKTNILQAKISSEPVQYEKIEFMLPEGFNWSEQCIADLRLNYKLLGSSRLRNETVFTWSHLSEDFLATDFILQKPNIEKFDFLFVDNITKRILVKTCDSELNDSLIIPAGYTVICREGTRLDLKNNATILSYSPLQFYGSEDYPIIISSSDSTGQGIAVLNAGEMSVLENVVLKNLSAPSHHGWQLTGAITFYESPVEIGGCIFSDNKAGDDMLNLIRTEFEIKNSLFEHTLSDALDVDFGKGAISHVSFVDCGNDGMDFSGSVVDVMGCFVNGAGDKGVSVGENSRVNINQTELKSCYIASASKDMSQVTIENVKVSASEVGFAVYQKKSEFGPSVMTISSVEMINVTTQYIVEDGSTLLVDDQKVDATQKNVWEILYGKK